MRPVRVSLEALSLAHPGRFRLTQELSADSGHTEGQQDVCDATYSVRVSKHRAKLCTSLQQATDSARAAGAQA